MRLVVCLAASLATATAVGGATFIGLCWMRDRAARRASRAGRVLIVNQDDFNEKRNVLIRGGKAALQVIMDFDYTMTSFQTKDGRQAASTHGVFARSGLLSDAFVLRERELFETYYPHETNPDYSPDEREVYMQEWWTLAHENFVAAGITRSILEQSLEPERSPIVLRDRCRDMMNLLQRNDIPLLVFSAGIADVIEGFLEHEGLDLENTHILSNRMIMNDDELLVGFQEPIVHSSNKAQLVERAAHVLHPSRAAFIVVGDHVHDALMCDSIPYAEVHLKIGLLNTDVERRLPYFKDVYDVIITGDGSLDFIYDLIHEISLQ